MAGPVQIQLKGAKQFARLAQRLHEMPQHVLNTLSDAVKDEASRLGKLSQRIAPKDTRRLWESYTHRVIEADAAAISVIASYSAPYAEYVHKKKKWGEGSVKGVPGTPYPKRRWFVKAARHVSKGLIGRVIRKLRPVLRALYMGNRAPVS